MISYAQNAEDVVLARALLSTSGFYVDVGAGHPEIASVTKHFYDLGWHGINIEPRSDAIALLNQQRPRDINLMIAAGAFNGTAELYVIDGDPDLSTVDRSDLEYLRDRGYGFASETVPVRTLDGVFEEHGVTAIDFLKIDVEGSEADVLEGIDLSRWAPTVIVIESILPWSRERNDATWRTLLESHGYRETCFDGINLFFASERDAVIAGALAPASVLDDYETAGAAATRAELDQLRAYISKLEEEIARYEEREREVSGYVRTLESEHGPLGGIASPIDLHHAQRMPLRSNRDRPRASARLAIVGTPQTGDAWIRTVLADILDANELPVQHPADVDWAGLPDRFVIQLHWQRSQFLEGMLRERGVQVISTARHPLEVLLSILAHAQHDESTIPSRSLEARNRAQLRGLGAGDPAFVEWAVSSRACLLLSLTPEWWAKPTTHRLRYEQLMDDPHGEFVALLARCELEPVTDPRVVLERHSVSRADALDRDVEASSASPIAWRETLPADFVDTLTATHREVFVGLGYDPDDRALA